jgi:anti-anti-sigma factor
VLDLSRVGFLSASGCRALAAGTRRFRDAGGRVLLADPVPFVKQILRLAGVDRLMHLQLAGGH